MSDTFQQIRIEDINEFDNFTMCDLIRLTNIYLEIQTIKMVSIRELMMFFISRNVLTPIFDIKF